MRHNYTGDEGDFTKYALLRTLRVDDPERVLAVNWYLTVHAEKNAHGNVLRHLETPDEWAMLDQDLLTRFVQVFNREQREARHVGLLEDAQMVGPRTRFFHEPLPTGELPTADRMAAREAWHARALAATASADIVFLDPDTGVEVPSRGPRSKWRCKYATYAEIGDYLDRGQVVVCYQHARRVAWNALVPGLADEMRAAGVQMARPGFIAFGTRGYLLLAGDHAVVDRMLTQARKMRADVLGNGFTALKVTVLPEQAGA